LKTIFTIFALLALLPVEFAAAQKPSPAAANADRLGLTCRQVLQMTSADWVGKFAKEKGATPEATVRGLAVYGECYDARTNRLAGSLAKSGKGPLVAARGNFRDFEQALIDFAAKALAATNPPAGAVKIATAALYQREFRYEFYRGYAEQTLKAPAQQALTPATNLPAKPAADALNAPPVPPSPAAPEDTDPMTKAKNRFGELLDALPEENLREIHKAFGRIFSGGPVTNAAKFAVYRYAIFCLESPSATPLFPPPF
jgi:hypothetical protein